MSPRSIARMLVGAALPALLAGPLAAQGVQGGEGLWFGGGLGPGRAMVLCHICRADRGMGPTAQLRLGGRLKPGVLVGAEATVWAGGPTGVNESMWGLAAVGYFSPHPRGAFYWKAGLGYLSWHSSDGQDVLSAGSVALVGGFGWEFRISRRLTLAPWASVFAAPIAGSIKFNGGAIQPGAALMLAQLGLSLTKH
jgi:hypothetical protein